MRAARRCKVLPAMPDMTDPLVCSGCATEIAPSLRACPHCGRLVHADELKRLAEEASQADKAGDVTAALTSWRSALELLPPNSRQYNAIAAIIAELGQRSDAKHAGKPPTTSSHTGADSSQKWKGSAGAAGLGGLALAAWKFKFLAVMALSKGKLLLFGLTKASTFFSMLLSLGVYWAAFGWKWALGVVISIYIHEMGHVAALIRYGIKASPPMFIPGFGAVVRLRQALTDPRQDARVGMAGPLWGLGAAISAYGVSLVTGSPSFAAIARVGAWINLFNLMPLWTLDGGRAFRALNRPQRWLAVALIAVLWSVTYDGILVLLLLVGAFHTATTAPAAKPDRG